MTQIKYTLKTYRYRLYPTQAQVEILVYLCRTLYNAALQERRDAYRKAKVTRSYVDQAGTLKEIKQALPEYKKVYSQVLQDVLKRVKRQAILALKVRVDMILFAIHKVVLVFLIKLLTSAR